MKKNDFIEMKALDTSALGARAKKLRKEIADLILEKNINKLKDVKIVSKKKKELARVLTILNQKQLIALFGEQGGTK